MSCNQTTQVHQYHDGELLAAERSAFEGHLATCAECRELLADLRGLSVLIGQAPLADLPADAAGRLTRRRPWTSDGGLIRVAGWLTAAAAAVMIVALLKGPAEPTQVAVGPGLWRTLSVTPSVDIQDEAVREVVLAQWMADELSEEQVGDLR